MGNELVNYNEKWAAQAEAYVSQEQLQGGTFLSTRGGILMLGDQELPGNQACVIVLDAVRENTYYAGKFDPDTPSAPACYAFGRGDGADMAPHESMQVDLNYFQPQNDTCRGCPQNEWGTADTGRGKACQNRRRLALIPAGYYEQKRGSRDFDLHLFDEPKAFQTSEIVYTKLSIGSVKEWGKYVNQLSASLQRPPHGVITRIFVEPHPKWQFVMYFEMVEQVPDELAEIIMARHDEASRGIIQGYKVPEAREARPQGSLRGLRRQ